MSKADALEKELSDTFLSSDDLKTLSVDQRHKMFAARQAGYDAIAALRESEEGWQMTADALRESEAMLAVVTTGAAESNEDNAILRAERDRLRTALEQYADPEFYHAIAFMVDSPCGGFAHDFGDDHGHPHYDRTMPGKLARQALDEKDEPIFPGCLCTERCNCEKLWRRRLDEKEGR